MKEGIHPEYVEAKAHCSCGAEATTRSTRDTDIGRDMLKLPPLLHG